MSARAAYDLFVSYAPADKGWVEGYLFDALDAARVSYMSEAAFELGAPRVAEFERAVRASRRTLLVITTAYLADAYAPFGDLLAQTFGVETGTWPVIPLTLEESALPPRLAMLVALDATRPENWGTAVDRLCAAIDRPVPVTTPPPCPYPGMLPFREADAAHFFGRDAEVADMLERLRLHRLLAVVGPSGTGKSSLVLAGLVPALRVSGLFGSGRWHVVVFRPGAIPLDTLELAFGGATGAPRTLVVCDQFEEIFTIGREQAAAFQERVAGLARSGRCWVVITARADFYAELMSSPLWPEIRAHRVEVAPLGEAALRAAIVRPAEAVGVHVDPALVARLVADAASEPGVLPLVQEALVLSWERLARRYLPLEAYQGIAGDDGGTTGRTGLQAAMARRADAALEDLSPEQQMIARRVFVRLVQFGEGRADTRRQQRLADLRAAGDDPAALDAAVNHLVDHRLLTSSGGDDAPDRRIDLAHEALISGWPTLRGWLTERREAERARRRLDGKAAEWVRLGRGTGGLLDEVELVETERWLAGPDAAEVGFDPALADLAATSRDSLDRARAARRRRVRVVVGSLAAGLVLVTGLAVWGAISARSSRRQEQRAREAVVLADEQRAKAEAFALEARSRQLAAGAVAQLDRELDRAMLLAVQAYRTEPTLPAKSALLSALEFSPRLIKVVDTGASSVSRAIVAFGDDDAHIAAVIDGELRHWTTETGEELSRGVQLVYAAGALSLSPDGRVLAAASCRPVDGVSECEIRLWDVASGAELGDVIETPGQYVYATAVSPDRSILAVSYFDVARPAIRLWDLEADRWLGRPMPTRARSLAFSPDGRTLASGLASVSDVTGDVTGESTVSLWDVSTQELLAETPVASLGGVTAIGFRPDGSQLAAGHYSGDVTVLRATDLQEVESFAAPSGVLDVEYSRDGDVLATASAADDHVLLWTPDDRTPSEEFSGHTGEINDLTFSADGRRLASVSIDGRLIVWGTRNHHVLRRGLAYLHRDAVSDISFDSDVVVTVGPGSVGIPQVWRWDTQAGEARRSSLPANTVFALRSDGRTAVVGDWTGTLTSIDTVNGEQVGAPIRAHLGHVLSVAVSGNGRLIASGGCPNSDPDSTPCDGSDAEVAVWDAESGRRIAGGPVDVGSPVDVGYRLALSPDGHTLAVTSGGSEVILWDVENDRPIGEPLVGAERTEDLAWSRDSRILAVAASTGADTPAASRQRNNSVILWDVATRTRMGEPLLGHDDGVSSVAFSPDGTVLASGDHGGEIRLWDVETRSLLGDRIDTGSVAVSSLRFSPDGAWLVSGQADGRVHRWVTSADGWSVALCALAGRNLTEDEWAEFVGESVAYESTCPEGGS